MVVFLLKDSSNMNCVDKNWSWPGGPKSTSSWYYRGFGYGSRDQHYKNDFDKEEASKNRPPNYYLKSKACGVIKILMNPHGYYWNVTNEARFS